MGWTSTFQGDKGYIEYLFTGDLSFKELEEAVLHALKHSDEQNINKFLADCREIKFSSSTSILETYELA
jgi:hypothetical protein